MNTVVYILPWVIAGLGTWAVVNGVLHDIFVLVSGHGKKYDRDLLRLLMDGHVLITCGAVLLFCITGIHSGEHGAYFIAITCCASLVVYCAMIWPFLKSVATTFFSLSSLVLLLFAYLGTNS